MTRHSDDTLLSLFYQRQDLIDAHGGNPLRGVDLPDDVEKQIYDLSDRINIMPARSPEALRAKVACILDDLHGIEHDYPQFLWLDGLCHDVLELLNREGHRD